MIDARRRPKHRLVFVYWDQQTLSSIPRWRLHICCSVLVWWIDQKSALGSDRVHWQTVSIRNMHTYVKIEDARDEPLICFPSSISADNRWNNDYAGIRLVTWRWKSLAHIDNGEWDGLTHQTAELFLWILVSRHLFWYLSVNMLLAEIRLELKSIDDPWLCPIAFVSSNLQVLFYQINSHRCSVFCPPDLSLSFSLILFSWSMIIYY